MEIMEAMKQRHSVRQYTDQRIEKEAAEKLQGEIDACNKESAFTSNWSQMNRKRLTVLWHIMASSAE